MKILLFWNIWKATFNNVQYLWKNGNVSTTDLIPKNFISWLKVHCNNFSGGLTEEKAVWLSTWNCEIFSNFQTFSSQRICKKCIFTRFIASIASEALAHLAAGIQPPRRKREHSLQERITPAAANFLPDYITHIEKIQGVQETTLSCLWRQFNPGLEAAIGPSRVVPKSTGSHFSFELKKPMNPWENRVWRELP